MSGNFAAILADPPWSFATYSAKGKGRSPEAHYDCMSLAEIIPGTLFGPGQT